MSTFTLPDAVLDPLPLTTLPRLAQMFLPGSRYFRFTDHPSSIQILSKQVSGLAQKRSHHGGKHAAAPTTPLYKDLEASE